MNISIFATCLIFVSVALLAGIALAQDLKAGSRHTCALTVAGEVYCWGYNGNGQCGIGQSNEFLNYRRLVKGIPNTVMKLSAKGDHTCTLDMVGAMYCWGYNGNGQLGTGSYGNEFLPVAVVNMTSGVTDIATGWQHTCAIRSGYLYCWGYNGYGQIGDGSTGNRLLPTYVGLSGVTSIACGGYHTCAIVSSGQMYCWGYNNYGQVGDGTTGFNKPSPTPVSGISSAITMALGYAHSCVLTSVLEVYCWGYNYYGQVGDGTTSTRTTAEHVLGLSGVELLSANSDTTCAAYISGSVYCWGSNSYGQMGIGNAGNSFVSPTKAFYEYEHEVTLLVTGSESVCVAVTGGDIYCSGYNVHGQLGDGSETNRVSPVLVGFNDLYCPSLSPTFLSVSLQAGLSHTCALTEDGSVYCWGYNYYGQCGVGSFMSDVPYPSLVENIPHSITKLSVLGDHSCVLDRVGAMYCWGYNGNGQLGTGDNIGVYSPTLVSGMSRNVTDIATGWYHTCAIRSGNLYCWGYNYYGQIGDGLKYNDRYLPTNVRLPECVASIACGGYHTCAIVRSGQMYCWGYNYYGQVGTTTYESIEPYPLVVMDIPTVRIMALGNAHTCVLTIEKDVYCWGYDYYGQTGDGSNSYYDYSKDKISEMTGVDLLTANADTTCAAYFGGEMYCWGSNENGQMGDGNYTLLNIYPKIAFEGYVYEIALLTIGSSHICVANVQGKIYCSGYNGNDQLGDGTYQSNQYPVLVQDLSFWNPTFSPTFAPTFTPTGTPIVPPTRAPTFQPSYQPTFQPTFTPTFQPTLIPSHAPTNNPTSQPSLRPSCQPSGQPSKQPTIQPSMQPTSQPTFQPTRQPSTQPSGHPSGQPSRQPSRQPSAQPTKQPSSQPSTQPSRQPSIQPSLQSTSQPSGSPTMQPTRQPSIRPTTQPSSAPTMQPSAQPTRQPSRQPSARPTLQPSSHPTFQPSRQPSIAPSVQPTVQPTLQPSIQPTCQPSRQPSRQPSNQPSINPSAQPSSQPSSQPFARPTSQPSMQPTRQPSQQPTGHPSSQPSSRPTRQPSCQPTDQPTSKPTMRPSCQPSVQPSCQPSMQPTGQPSTQPSRQPSVQPTAQPTIQPSSQPTMQPSFQPISRPTAQPTYQPSVQPSHQPSTQPSLQPSRQPSTQPSSTPSIQPSSLPTCQPSVQPSYQPSQQPTCQPSIQPSVQPTRQPTSQPSHQPSRQPTAQPSFQPTNQPSTQPSCNPTCQPTVEPTTQPSIQPSNHPSVQPSTQPSIQPTQQPTQQPTNQPTKQPSMQPTNQPTSKPSIQPSMQPTNQPSLQPSSQPSKQPSIQPSGHPSCQPSRQPSSRPSRIPSTQPSSQPSCQPSGQPSSHPSMQPIAHPSRQPTKQPSNQPSRQPSSRPSGQPSTQPSVQPSIQPSRRPTSQPSDSPTGQPTSHPTLQPSRQPSQQPTVQPSNNPTSQPSVQPTRQPSIQPSQQPTQQPSCQPTSLPSVEPSQQPSSKPSTQPSRQPTVQPSFKPSKQPSGQPSSQPTMQPSMQPSNQPTIQPTVHPTGQPSEQPSRQPTGQPSGNPSLQPVTSPSTIPTSQPSTVPTPQPSMQPSMQPSSEPTGQPTIQPSAIPTTQPSTNPSFQPSLQPSSHPSSQPSCRPSAQPTEFPTSQPSNKPSSQPSGFPTAPPSEQPSMQPSSQPTDQPNGQPSSCPSVQPTVQPSCIPTTQPSSQPTGQPTGLPTMQPSIQPTIQPSIQPFGQPTSSPSQQPFTSPTHVPSVQPTIQPSAQPSAQPSSEPTAQPNRKPTGQPSRWPSRQPSAQPSSEPTSQPSHQPSNQPFSMPTSQPTGSPSTQPSRAPTDKPSGSPSRQPSTQPTCHPSHQPSRKPSCYPSSQPSRQPSASPSRSISSEVSDATTLSVSFAEYVNDESPHIKIWFSRDTNTAYGPKVFPCYSLLNITTEIDGFHFVMPSYFQSCRWLSSRSLMIVGNEELRQVINQRLVRMQVGILRSSKLLALVTSVPVSYTQELLLLRYPSDSDVENRVPIVGLHAEFVSDSKILDMTVGFVTPAASMAKTWATSVVLFDVRCYNVSVDTNWALRNLSSLLSSDSAAYLRLAMVSRHVVLQLTREKYSKYWQIPELQPKRLNVSVTLTLCDEYQNCGNAVSSLAIPVDAILLSESKQSLVVSLSSFPQRNSSCSSGVAIKSAVYSNVQKWNYTLSATQNLAYTWMMKNFSVNRFVNLATTSQDPSVFRLSKYSLVEGVEYSLLVKVRDTVTGATGRSALSKLNCFLSPLRLQLFPSQKVISLRPNEILTLNTSGSYDPDAGRTFVSAIVMQWKCRSFALSDIGSASLSLLSEATRRRLALPFCVLNVTDAVSRSVLHAIDSSTAVSIRANFLISVNTTSELTVTMTDVAHPLRSAVSATVEVQILSSPSPILRLINSQVSLQKVNPRRILSLHAAVQHPRPSVGILTANWIWSTDISNSLLRTMTTNNITHTIVDAVPNYWTHIQLSLKAGVLTSGAYYLFRLSCGSSVMDVEVTTNAVPSGGNFAVSPNSGWTLETLFTLTASSWRDNDEDYPLRYAFSVYEHPYRSVRSSTISLTGTWTVIPNDGQWYLEAVYLPAGMMNQSYVVRVKCVVSDSLEGSTSIGANSTVFPYRSWTTASSTAVGRRLLLSMALPPSQVIVESMSTLVSNVSVASSAMRLQQTITAVTVMLRQDMQQGSSGMFSTLNSQERMELATLLASQVNVSLVKTDIEQEPAAVWLLGNISQLIGDTKVAIAQEASAKALQSLGQKLNNGTSVVSSAALASQTASLMSSLAQSLLSNSGGSEPQTVQVVTETVKLSLALVSVPPIDPNATTVQYLPPLGVPDSKSTINIAQNAGASGSAMISVAAYDASLFQAALAAKAVNSTSTSDGLPKPTLSSDIISISVSYTGDSGEAVLPSFVANMEVEDEGFVAPYFQHNCTVGSVETLSFLCPKSLVRMNLTCSGKAAANVRRRCPVPQQVCNVLSMSDLSVASASYCHAFPNSDSTVTCICGMDNSESGKNSSSQLSSLLGSGAAINVAVMTQFVAGDFGGTVVGGTGNIDASLATKSQIIFVSFGLLWGFGVISMIVHFYDLDFSVFGFGKKDGKALKIEAANPALSATKQRDGLQMNDAIARASQAKQKAYDTMKKYLVSVLPTIYHPVPWLIRLKDQLFHHHKYISFFTFLISMVGYIIPMKMKRHIQQHRTEQDMMSDEQKRKKSVLQVAYMLSAITISCFTLSVLYDIQYPADDGSCVSHVTESSCLLRKTVLDPSRSYCKWVPFTQGSAGSITESREGKIIQSIPLESVLVETDHIQCVFDDSDASGMAMLTALLITTMVTLPFDTVLKLIFQLLAVKSDKEVKLRAQVKETMLSRGIKAADEANMSSSIQRGGRRGGILVTTNPDVVTKELIKNVVKEANSKTSELSPAEATSIDAENSVIVRQSRLSKLRNIFKVKVAIKTPTVIQRIHQARKDSLEKWSALHDWQLYGASRKKFYANRKQLMQMLQTLTSLTRSATLQKQEVKFQQDRFEFCTRQLQNATHEEFGMTVLQTLYMDILDQETPIGNRFQRVLYKDFPIEKYVSEKLQWFLMGVVACLVLGALFYVILKGSGRGQAWQRALLRICFLDWFIEVIVHQTFEVYFVHFLLPNLIYEDVQMTLAALLRSYAALVHDTMKYRGTVPVGELTLRTALAEQQPSPSLDSYSTLLVTQQAVLAAVVEKRALMESQLTMYFNSNRFFANEDEMPRQSFVLPRRMNPILSYVLQGLFVISGFPIPLQRVMGGLISSALFSAMSTMWIAMKHVRASGGIMATVVIVMTMLIAAGLIYWHRRTLFYYLSASYMPRKIAAIAPVAHTLDELDKEEEEEKKDGGPDSDDENGSHWSWSGSDSESAIESRDDSSKASHSTHMSSAVSEQSSIWQDDTARQMIASMLYPSMYDSPDVFELGMYGPNMMFMPSLDFEEATEMVDMTIPEMELNANLFQSMDSMDSPKNADIMEEKDMDFIDSFHQQMFGVPFSPSQMLHIPLDSRSDDYSGSSIDSTRDDDCRSMGTFGSDSPHHSHYYRIPSMTVPMYHYDLHNEIYLEPMQDAMLVAPRNMGLIPNQDTLYTLSSQSKGADMHVKPQHNVVLMQPTSALDSALDSDFDADFLNGGDRNVSNM